MSFPKTILRTMAAAVILVVHGVVTTSSISPPDKDFAVAMDTDSTDDETMLMPLSSEHRRLPSFSKQDDDEDNEQENNIIPNVNDKQLAQLSYYLTQALLSDDIPVVFIMDEAAPQIASYAMPSAHQAPSDLDDDNMFTSNAKKRSRYYRRYPWKRQNSRRSRNNYDPDQNICTPNREEVFQLLMALHEARQGNHGRTVNFCNRRRPASSVFTNIRFLGRRK